MFKPIILTFDDNAFNHYYNVFPLLKKYKMNATYAYITSQVYSINDNNTEIIREMKDYGIEFASHTHTHIDLMNTDTNKAIIDLNKSINILETHNFYNPGLICPFNRINNNITNNIKDKFKYIIHKSFSVNNFEGFINIKNATKYNLIRLEFPTKDQTTEDILKFYNILYNLNDDDLPIIMFHNICDHKINMQVDVNTFNNFLFFIKSNHFNTYTLNQVIDNIENNGNILLK